MGGISLRVLGQRRALPLLLAAAIAATSIVPVALAAQADTGAAAAKKKKKKKCKAAASKKAKKKKKKCKGGSGGGTTTPGGTSPGAGTSGLARLLISPTSKDFGMVGVGTHSPPQTFLVTNAGAGSAIPVTFRTSGANATDFHVPPTTDFCSGNTLAVGAACNISVNFGPGDFSLGPRSATLTMQTNTGTSAVATLAGFGIP